MVDIYLNALLHADNNITESQTVIHQFFNKIAVRIYYSFIKNIINKPLIICNSAMVCINSYVTDQELFKILNIISNSSTGFILSFISNFMIYEHKIK